MVLSSFPTSCGPRKRVWGGLDPQNPIFDPQIDPKLQHVNTPTGPKNPFWTSTYPFWWDETLWSRLKRCYLPFLCVVGPESDWGLLDPQNLIFGPSRPQISTRITPTGPNNPFVSSMYPFWGLEALKIIQRHPRGAWGPQRSDSLGHIVRKIFLLGYFG